MLPGVGRIGQHGPAEGVGVPAWASGVDLWEDFTVPRGSLADPTDTHASTIYAPNAAGVYAPFAANVLTRTDLGLQTVPTRTNLFLNSFAVATQTVTVAAATVYTVSITGTGSIALSGAGTGTVVAGTPVTFTASTTSLTLTVTGSPSTCNLEAGAFATPPILTAGASATVNGNQQVIDLTGRLGTGVAGIVQMNLLEAGSNYRKTMRVADATATNFIDLYYNSGNLNLNLTAASVTQAELSLGTWPSGICTVAFAVSGNYVQGRIVGVAPPSADVVATYPATLDRLALGGSGNSANENIFQFSRKLALSFGPQDATTFAAMYARAVLAAAA